MRFLALILFIPTFAILSWLFVAFPREEPRTPARTRFNLLAIAIAFSLSALAVWHGYTLPPPGGEAIWQQIYASLAAYHVFPVTLALAWWLRRRISR